MWLPVFEIPPNAVDEDMGYDVEEDARFNLDWTFAAAEHRHNHCNIDRCAFEDQKFWSKSAMLPLIVKHAYASVFVPPLLTYLIFVAFVSIS
jgi:hypothetical protein